VRPFFGVVRTAIFLALYRQQEQVAGLDVRDALTYVWVLEGLFGVVWVAWFWELTEAIRSGEFVVELLRPGDDGTTRVLVVDLAADEPVEVEGAVVARAEGRRRWLEFARDEVSAAELIGRLLAVHEVADLTLEEPDIQDIVRRIYRGEVPP
jgi:hypothetical protein